MTAKATAGTVSIGSTTLAVIKANNDMYCFQKRIEKFPLDVHFQKVHFQNKSTKINLHSFNTLERRFNIGYNLLH